MGDARALEVRPAKRRASANAARVAKIASRYAALIALSVLFALPFAWMVSTSLTPAEQVLSRYRPLIPPHPAWSNYREALTVLPFLSFLKNTLTIAVLCTIGQTFSASLVAFAFARLNFPFRGPLFLLVLATMMLPPQVTMIPTFVLFTIPHWIDTLRPLIVPAFFGGGAFFIFLLRQFFMTIPVELEEAARLDGCNTFGVYWHVVLPNARPALATVALFSFMGHWNDFLGPLIYLQSLDKKTLALGLAAFKSLHGTEYHLLMAASVAVLIPILVIFFLAQRYFTEGVVMSGVKG
jgi:ABC-type glycerol-3-phosphate transport system permease component